jgi:hypothetical protein
LDSARGTQQLTITINYPIYPIKKAPMMKSINFYSQVSAFAIIAFMLSCFATYAQEEATEETTVEPVKERPARPAFESGLLFDAATTTLQPSKTLEMVIQHRFGTIENGISDFYGVWAPSNIRLGLNYSILDNLMVGIGATKFNKMEDIQVKYNILQQTRSNKIPVTVSLYEVIGIDGSADDKFGVNYKFAHRFNFFSQIIVSRRFNDMFSFQIAPGFTHYNSVDSIMDHDKISISFAGRVKFSPQSSLIIGADIPLQIQGISEHTAEYNETNSSWQDLKSNICIGYEVSTSTHAFHLYLGSGQGILPQENIMFNKNDFFKKGILIGLNITRLWSF